MEGQGDYEVAKALRQQYQVAEGKAAMEEQAAQQAAEEAEHATVAARRFGELPVGFVRIDDLQEAGAAVNVADPLSPSELQQMMQQQPSMPTDEVVATLLSMDFSPNQIKAAYIGVGYINDVNVLCSFLLDNPNAEIDDEVLVKMRAASPTFG